MYLFYFCYVSLSVSIVLQARLSRYLKLLYTELALKEPIVPPWAHPTAPGALCPARLEPDFRLHSQSHGFSDCLSVDQLLTPIQVCCLSFASKLRRHTLCNGRHLRSFHFMHVIKCTDLLLTICRQKMDKYWKHHVVCWLNAHIGQLEVP